VPSSNLKNSRNMAAPYAGARAFGADAAVALAARLALRIWRK
jgi:hypothetical protein